MNDFWGDIRIQQLSMLLVVSFAIALIILGLFIRKYRFLDYNKKTEHSLSRSVSNIFFALATVIGVGGIIGLILTFFL